MRVEGKCVIVTGAGSGFGRAMALTLAAEGAKVFAVDRDEGTAAQVATEICNNGQKAVSFSCDVTDASRVKQMVANCISELGGLDIMINNAGYTHASQPMDQVSEDEYDRVMNVNVKSIYLSTLEVLPHFRKQGSGVILNTASTAGLRPRPGMSWYNASKGAVITLTKSMAVELAPEQIRVNCVCPVAANTPMLGDFIGDRSKNTEEVRKAMGADIPLGRLTEAQDVANAALYLVSPEAEFITGVALEIDGGRCIS
ncbi:MAG: glucose 1-dehydrogenase [Pseudomonadales bacterium]|nr:glucose 1-dehydrogenase [Pseudomonadales bacterium]